MNVDTESMTLSYISFLLFCLFLYSSINSFKRREWGILKGCDFTVTLPYVASDDIAQDCTAGTRLGGTAANGGPRNIWIGGTDCIGRDWRAGIG